MTNYISRRAEMLDRLFEEDRPNTEYRSAFEHAAFALLRVEGKMEAIERTVYKKLFGDDPKDKEDDAENANSTPAPKKRKVVEFNDGESAETSVTPTVTEEKETQGARDPIESNITEAVASISYRDQAAKTPPPLEEKQLTDREKRVMAKREAAKAKMGPAAWQRLQEANKNTAEITDRCDAALDKRNKLLPMRPGGMIQQFSTYAPPTRECENYLFAEDGAQIKKVEQRLNFSVKCVFKRTCLFRLWPEPADWDAFEKDPVKGMQLLARCEKFLQFWVWVFISTDHTTGRFPLTSCLEWFLLGETSPKYKEFTKYCFRLKVNDAR